jgi:hypothetical protein
MTTPASMFIYESRLDGERWFIYWLGERQVLGATNGRDRLYRSAISREDRRVLLANVADSLLEETWRCKPRG